MDTQARRPSLASVVWTRERERREIPHDVSSDPARQRLHFDPAKPSSVVLVVSALAAAGGVSKPTLEMFQAASPYVVATARVASQGHPGLSRLIPD